MLYKCRLLFSSALKLNDAIADTTLHVETDLNRYKFDVPCSKNFLKKRNMLLSHLNDFEGRIHTEVIRSTKFDNVYAIIGTGYVNDSHLEILKRSMKERHYRLDKGE